MSRMIVNMFGSSRERRSISSSATPVVLKPLRVADAPALQRAHRFIKGEGDL